MTEYGKPKIRITFAAVALCVVGMAGILTACQGAENTGYVTYEFETFDGETVKIDEANIISQETEKNVFETCKVPDDAEVVASGRDYVYLADENYYYMEDATKNLLTVASREKAADMGNPDAPANRFEERVEKNTFESYDEIIGLLEGSEAYAYASVKGYDGEVLFVSTETFDDMLGHYASTEATLYTAKAGGITSDGTVFSSSSSTPVAIDKEGVICTASHRSVEKRCYVDNGTNTPVLTILATVQAERLDDNYQPQNISGFMRTQNPLIDDDCINIPADDLETYNRMFDDYQNARVLNFTRANGDTPSKQKIAIEK